MQRWYLTVRLSRVRVTLHNYLLFAGASLVLAIVPGPNMIYMLGRWIAQGHKAGLMAAIGVNLGGYAHLSAAILRLSAVIATLIVAFSVLKWLSAGVMATISGRVNGFLRVVCLSRASPTLGAIFLFIAVGDPVASANVRLPRVIGDHMVLQRDTPLRIWGWAEPGEHIEVQFRSARVSDRADETGHWSVMLGPQRAGGPDELFVRGRNMVTLTDILVGDVWIASGQSNMQFPMAPDNGFGGVQNSESEIRTANYPRLRLFLVEHSTALQVQTDVQSTGWAASTPESVSRFSAVAFLFGRALHERYHVPIGLIESSWGGTPAETWMSPQALRGFAEFRDATERQARVDAPAMRELDSYFLRRNAWYLAHGSEDRGRRDDGVDQWAAALYDASDWPTVPEPQPWPRKAVKEFDGTMWFRKQITIGAEQVGKDLRLHLSKMAQADTTYFNGNKVGATAGGSAGRNYEVPATDVKTGQNVIVVRLGGAYASGDGYVGMLGDASDMYAEIDGARIPLAGIWTFQPGPDLSELPEPPALAAFKTPFPQEPSILFKAMIAPLTRFNIKGAIWYQGEDNVGRARQYRALFPSLIRDWRTQWGTELPFLFVQLAGYGSDPEEPADSPWAELREAQASALRLPRTGMATAIDVGDVADIHPRNKQAVAQRLALAAAKVAYHTAVIHSGPTYREMRIEGAAVRLTFSYRGTGLCVGDASDMLRGFAIAGTDGRFVWAQARLDGLDVIVWSDTVLHPVTVRYDWANTPNGNLYNREGLPAVPFRTDTDTR